VKLKVSFLREGAFDAESLINNPARKVDPQDRHSSPHAAC